MITVDLTVAPPNVEGTYRRQVAQVGGGAALYATGGEAVDPSLFRMGKIFIILGGISNGTEYLMPFYDVATDKLIWFDNGTGNEVVNGADLSGYSGRVEVVGQ